MDFIETIDNPRQEWKVVHKLKYIVVIVLFATLANADDWVEMEIFARSTEQLLKKYITLENGIHSHDTISITIDYSIESIDVLSHVDLLESNVLGDKAYGTTKIREYITSKKATYIVNCN